MLLLSISNSTRGVIIQLLRTHLEPAGQKVNCSTKAKTHYDVLKVTPNATHNEIKSAYYKLTLQYHPDKNKTESAKHKFQQISSAYEVIGSYTTRKQYDRLIQVKHGNFATVGSNDKWKPDINHPSSGTKIYDFTEWTQMHYQDTFAQKQERKEIFKQYQKFVSDTKAEADNKMFATIMLMLGLGSIIWIGTHVSDNDTPVQKKPPSRE